MWRRSWAKEAAQLLGALRRTGYDLALDCQGLARSGLFAWATRAPVRVGFADAREGAWLGVNRRVRTAQRHTVDRMLALVEAVGVEPVRDMRLHSPPGLALPEQLTERRYAVVAPTSRWPGKRWPAERFAQLVERLLAEGLVERVAVVGGAGERAQCAPLLDLAQEEQRVVDLVGATDVGQLLKLIERSALVVANDSAALHIAVGFDRPIVGLFGPTRVERVGPYGREQDVLQRLEPNDRFDHKNAAAGARMMARISVDEAFEAAAQRLATAAETAQR